LDVGVAKPLIKYELRDQWESWLIKEESVHEGSMRPTKKKTINNGTTTPPKRE